jgi:hypothetical protein
MKRDVTVTYWKLIEKFTKCPTGKVRHFAYTEYAGPEAYLEVSVSYAHNACLCYLIWLGEQNLESCEAFLEAAVTWRKQAGRYATYRTAIEKLARIIRRRTLPKLRKQRAQRWGGIQTAQKQMEEGVGIHDPNYPPERRSEIARKAAYISHSKPRTVVSKKWWILDPKGNWYVIENMSAFCRKHGLDDKYMKYQATKEPELLRGGWNCRHFRETELNQDGLPPFAL